MCGIAGIFSLNGTAPVTELQIRRMLAAIRHRGPDEFGIYLDATAALGSARLSIIDVQGGQQPISNPDQTLWIVFNGEIFNYLDLRTELQGLGYVFSTATDTEVILYLYEQYGVACLERMNGQFAFAIWDERNRTLFMARDRLGIRPLFYTMVGDSLIFGSEIKALLTDSRVSAQIDPVGFDQVFTFWTTLTPRTIFKNILEVPPGSYLLAEQHSGVSIRRYWQLSFSSRQDQGVSPETHLEEFRHLLTDATRLRLRADVPVAAYLSGGLDSSTIAALIRREETQNLDTFSVAFEDPEFDESLFQQAMAGFLGTVHQVRRVRYADIGNVFPEVIQHTETPILRTSPAPMFLLSQIVHERGYKVVLTGEGADEFLGGYDLFKEAAIRRFWARQPTSKLRPKLLQRIYTDIPGLSQVSNGLLSEFFKHGLAEIDSPYYSHSIRWRNGRRARRFFSQGILDSLHQEEASPFDSIQYPLGFEKWHPLERAQYLESSIFLSGYLLSSQGDRMGMAHSVEGRFPFLDHRVVEFCARLPVNLKLRGLQEKVLLRRLGREILPEEIWRRPKRPYRAPIHCAFYDAGAMPEYLPDLLSDAGIRESGLFQPAAVRGLLAKLKRGTGLGETDDMSLVGIISSQLVAAQFVDGFRPPPPLDDTKSVKVCIGKRLTRTL